MLTFSTPEPIATEIKLGLGDISIVASDLSDSTVSVRPKDITKDKDIKAAESILVEFTNNILIIKPSKKWQRLTSKDDGSVVVEVKLPTGSSVAAKTSMGTVNCEGELSDAAITTGLGDVNLDKVESLLVKCRFGSIFARTVKDAKLATGSGTVQIGSTSGSVIIKNANGPIEVTNCQGDIYVRTKAGDISISKALASVTAKASFGTISINEVSSGHVSAQTNIGAIQIGIQKGVFASVGAISKYGIVQNDIAKSSKPNSTVEVYAKTKVGNITINQITV